ncbi:winged helix-turn-helix transcriptional regulator [Rhodobium gokarnense]|uniref:DNA-binding HxlR family transcriptional regulator n=1 Tax=Rhodobium gokarnense TaxID=364296 RepID=A0ABT3HAP7_9HYPH|nr:helix-turn-helix domain-containing protein [Rhodobium gokarnense]MCW2307473.1 DNA-binding HxlR family transcriptional regulator [Rhodobium gokarnense]
MDGTDLPIRHTADCMKASQVLSRIAGKWSVLVIMLLRAHPLRFSELKRGIEGISQRMLTLTLRNLERDGLVTRTVTPSIPPRVDYELTDLGHSLAGPIEAVGTWAFRNMSRIEAAQARYDATD